MVDRGVRGLVSLVFGRPGCSVPASLPRYTDRFRQRALGVAVAAVMVIELGTADVAIDAWKTDTPVSVDGFVVPGPLANNFLGELLVGIRN